jgi:sugar phosphate isomerase/epimerase
LGHSVGAFSNFQSSELGVFFIFTKNKKMTTRRDFLKTGAIGLASATFWPDDTWANTLRKHKGHIGVQLWSVRDFMAKDAKGTLEKLAKMGYRQVEGFGFDGKFFGMQTTDYVKFLQDNGLQMPSAHLMLTGNDFNDSTKQFSDSWLKGVEAAKQVGQQFVIAPYMLDPDRGKGERMAEIFNRAGEYCKTLDMKFGYHNHDFELKTKNVDGVSLYQTLLTKTDASLVTFEMDLYWVVFAGEKPEEWFAKYPGRFTHLHVKDLDATKRQTVEVGEGSIDFQAIFDKKKLAGARYFIVELEHYKRPSIEGVEVSLQNLKKLKF